MTWRHPVQRGIRRAVLFVLVSLVLLAWMRPRLGEPVAAPPVPDTLPRRPQTFIRRSNWVPAPVPEVQPMALPPSNPADLPWLIEELEAAEPERRSYAAAELGRLSFLASDALPRLRELAADDINDTVRTTAREAILNIRGYTSPPRDF